MTNAFPTVRLVHINVVTSHDLVIPSENGVSNLGFNVRLEHFEPQTS